ncbi:MAG: potassium channel family protein [Ruminococcaceae bacterium]|nr:potassium channel family protein [Oscillospiraceae bacterium]
MRKRIYEIIEVSKGDRASAVYDVSMMLVIFVSLLPLAFKETTPALSTIDKCAALIFGVDYLLRLATADLKLDLGEASFAVYPFTPMAIIDLLCILPSLASVSEGLQALAVLRLLRMLRILRAFKAVRYSRSLSIIVTVIREQREPLLAVGTLAVAYVLISALVIFNVEPDSFDRFFDAVYWATVSLTTVGYGDIYPVSDAGRVITMLSSFFGIAVVALPAGIITAGYMDKLQNKSKDDKEE